MHTLRHSLLIAGLLTASSLSAATITISNPSFEASAGYNGGNPSTIPGWTTFDIGFGTGTFGNVVDATSQFTAGLSGTNAIYFGGNIDQLTGATFQAGETYTLSLSVGNPAGVPGDTRGSFSFGFRNAANNGFLDGQLFVSNDDINAVSDGTFQTFSFTYTALAGDAGKGVRIAMTDFFYGPTSETVYRVDNVTLTTSAVPEPSTLMLGMLGLSALAFRFSRLRSRQQA